MLLRRWKEDDAEAEGVEDEDEDGAMVGWRGAGQPGVITNSSLARCLWRPQWRERAEGAREALGPWVAGDTVVSALGVVARTSNGAGGRRNAQEGVGGMSGVCQMPAASRLARNLVGCRRWGWVVCRVAVLHAAHCTALCAARCNADAFCCAVSWAGGPMESDRSTAGPCGRCAGFGDSWDGSARRAGGRANVIAGSSVCCMWCTSYV